MTCPAVLLESPERFALGGDTRSQRETLALHRRMIDVQHRGSSKGSERCWRPPIGRRPAHGSRVNSRVDGRLELKVAFLLNV
jgi:hypothetical protein